MVTELLLPNLLLFLAGQAAAWFYLRTGRWWVGMCSSALLWVLADWYFVAKYAFGATGVDLAVPLLAMQVVALATISILSWARWRRRWSSAARSRHERFAAGLVAYLRGDEELARQTFLRLVRTDPWDAGSWVALGDVELRAGRTARARRCFSRALGVDAQRQYADFVEHRLSRR